MNFPVFDFHCDTAFGMLGPSLDQEYSLRNNELHIDLLRAGTLAGYAQCFACFTSDAETLPMPIASQDVLQREICAITRGLAENSDIISQAFNAQDIEDNLCKGKMSAVLSLEGTAGFEYAPEALESLFRQGFRITTLGWNEENPLAGSHITGGGLTDKGREYVREAQRLGMIVDVSHISDEAFWDIVDITSLPVIASHSNSRSVWNVSRNLTDEMFCAIRDCGGVVGINLYPKFLGEDADIDTVCDHIFHFLSLDPKCEHIALGSDLDGIEILPRGFTGVQDYPKLAQHLLERGLPETMVFNVFWNNAVNLLKRCEIR